MDETVRAIRPATSLDREELVELFEAYRLFYGCASDPQAAERFVRERLTGGVSRFFIAVEAGRLVGFMHLQPAVDTLAMAPGWRLEDLFVVPDRRRCGIGSALLASAERFARDEGAVRIVLETAHTNLTAQRRYLSHGYVLDEAFRTYVRTLAPE